MVDTKVAILAQSLSVQCAVLVLAFGSKLSAALSVIAVLAHAVSIVLL